MRPIFAFAVGAVALAIAGAGVASASKTPAFIAAAIADKNRPADDIARDAARKPAAMVEFAGIKPGMVVVDLVPGRGYFTRIFAAAVGAKGHVYAFIPTEFDAAFKKRNVPIPSGTDPNYSNVTYIHASIATFPIPQYADVVWTSQNYHDLHDSFTGPVDLAVANKAILAALKPGGVFIVLDHAAQKGSGLRDTDTLHRIDPASVKSEVTAAGFVFAGESNVLRNPQDPHDKLVFDPSIRGKTDQFIFKFRKPKKK
jgi:predicted methyltransferase